MAVCQILAHRFFLLIDIVVQSISIGTRYFASCQPVPISDIKNWSPAKATAAVARIGRDASRPPQMLQSNKDTRHHCRVSPTFIIPYEFMK